MTASVGPDLLAALWLLVPAGAANMAPVLAARLLPAWDLPVDLGGRLRGQRLLGSHKTWRGMVAGVLAGGLVALPEAWAAARVAALPDPGPIALAVLFGAWIGLGALCGDLAKSFAKRRFGIAPGAAWFPFDQIDWVAGALVFALPVRPLSGVAVVAALLLGPALHLLVHALGRALGLNRSWI